MVKTLIENFFNWFRWRPRMSKPLPILLEKKPKDKEYTYISDSKNLFISIRIIAAKNIPNRAKNAINATDLEDNHVQPFIRIDYKNISARTDVARGPNPIWNESLYIPLE